MGKVFPLSPDQLNLKIDPYFAFTSPALILYSTFEETRGEQVAKQKIRVGLKGGEDEL